MEDVPRKLDLCAVVDRQKFSTYTLGTVATCFLVLVFEGYDIAAMAFALPGVAKEWRIRNVSDFGSALSASIIGMMIGSAILGQWGDRVGRRKMIIGACVVFSVFTGLIIYAATLQQLVALRLLAGIGLGGNDRVAPIAGERWVQVECL